MRSEPEAVARGLLKIENEGLMNKNRTEIETPRYRFGF
jgi:hypothetical protein